MLPANLALEATPALPLPPSCSKIAIVSIYRYFHSRDCSIPEAEQLQRIFLRTRWQLEDPSLLPALPIIDEKGEYIHD